jgi:hypothetical protein
VPAGGWLSDVMFAAGRVMANNRSSRIPNHGYVIFDETTGEILKFGKCSGKVRSDGLSYRALAQIRVWQRRGEFPTTKLSTVTLENFNNRATALNWEVDVVRIFRILNGGVRFPKQIRP